MALNGGSHYLIKLVLYFLRAEWSDLQNIMSSFCKMSCKFPFWAANTEAIIFFFKKLDGTMKVESLSIAC